MGKVAAAAKHNFREMDTPNARPEDRTRNIHLAGGKTTQEVLELWRERAPEKIRKNAVHALEYVVTASPEKMAAMGQTQSEAYLRDALTWLEEKHGARNILSAVIHNDETTPHLQVLVIPIDERGKLNARGLVGGKQQLSAMQTDFAERVGANYELERGIERSRARHVDIKTYYNGVNDVASLSFRLPERGAGGVLGLGRESEAEWRSRASEGASEAIRAAVAHGSKERQDLRDELAETKLRLSDTGEKLLKQDKMVKALVVAHNISVHEGPDRQVHIDRFERDYLEKGADFTPEVKYAIDNLLEDMGARGFWHVEQERLARESRESDRGRATLLAYAERDRDDYMLSETAEEHQDIIRLLREQTTDREYSLFRQGDLTAIDHITTDPVFARQLLLEVELDNRAEGYEMSPQTEARMEDARDFLNDRFGEDRDRDYENER